MTYNSINILIALILDWIIGDPYSFPHPVKLMGRIIRWEEKFVRSRFTEKKSLKLAGFFIVLVNIGLAIVIPLIILWLLSPLALLKRVVTIYLMYTCLAAKSLAFEAGMVKEKLSISLEEGRNRVAYIVGRETDKLNEEEIIKATIETVAENTADGVIAPLFYMMIFGVYGGMVYKFVNTMDSVLGYMDDKYIDIGHYPATIDDLFNYIPARLTAVFMLLTSVFKDNFKYALNILKRDKYNHKSPNSGFPESTVAGLLGIELGGDNYYHGVLVEKPKMGEAINKINLDKIDATIDIMYKTEILFVLFYLLAIAIIHNLW